MRIGPKYKIARRLGVPIFEKTQTPKYTLSLARKEKSVIRRKKPLSEFGLSLIEKQKARFTYGLSEKQFRKYVDKALKTPVSAQTLFTLLESRLDNVLFRSGLAKSRSQARQIASHGHALVNGRRVTIPSVSLSEGDTVGLRDGSAQSPLFGEVTERMKVLTPPLWLELDPAAKTAKVTGAPVYAPAEHVFDLSVVIEFYNR
ncbi:MAG: 30S ribosomal protein S4 [Candidatus Zambryskibacteria bacterium]|nr:30S ribosomal protein S4 [Candidatus Zambryskibacteria bacterium]